MSRLPSITPREMVRVLTRAAFRAEPERGSSHVGMRYPDGRKTVVPRHAKDLKRGTMMGILKDAGMSRETFTRLLRGN